MNHNVYTIMTSFFHHQRVTLYTRLEFPWVFYKALWKKSLTLCTLAYLVACADSSHYSEDALRTQKANPLATSDQALLDKRLAEFSSHHSFAEERALVRSRYFSAREPHNEQERARLDIAVDELVNGAIATSLNSNPLLPRVHWLGAGSRDWFGVSVPGTRWAFDNPDNVYRTVPIKAGEAYRITGQRRGDGPTDMTFSLINDPVTQGTEAFLDGKTLTVDQNGSYTISIDSEAKGERTNHLQSTAATQLLFIRSNLGDWDNEEHDALAVEYLGDTKGEELSDEEVAQRTSVFLRKAAPVYGLGLLGSLTYGQPENSFPAPRKSSAAGALISQAQSFGHFRLNADECLVITLKPGGAKYFIVPVTDPWMLSIDPSAQSSLNQDQALPDRDGRYTFVISPNDPGVHNWVDTSGLLAGTMMIRWQRLPADGGAPAIDVQLVKQTDLQSVLPEGTKMMNVAERQQQLSLRRTTYHQRFKE